MIRGLPANEPDFPALLPSALLGGCGPDGRGRVRRSARDWVVDVLAFLVALVFALLMIAVIADADPPPKPFIVVLEAVPGVLASFAIWLRRRWPVGLAVALGVISVVSGVAGMAALIALFTVLVHARLRIAAAVAGLHLTASIGYSLWRPDPDLSLLNSIIFTVLIVVVVVAWGMFVRSRRQLVLSLRDRASRAESEQALRVEQARQLERTRIAREMHDVLAHRISLLSLHAGALEYRLDAPQAEVARAAAVIRSSAHQALEDLRTVIGVLRAGLDGDDPERPQPVLADLPALLDESRQAGMRLTVVDGLTDPAAVPAAAGRTAYRLVQEGLTNARKHAPGAAVTVVVAGGPGEGLDVEVRNPWPVGRAGAPRIPGAGTGIIGLIERVHLAGGRIDHGRAPGGDFRLHAWLPWPLPGPSTPELLPR